MSNISSFLLPPRTHKRTITHVWARASINMVAMALLGLWPKWLDRMLLYYMRNKLVLATRPLSFLPPSLLSLPPSIWEKINEWRRRRQHSLDAVLHATDNDQREGEEGQRWRGRACWLAGGRAGITRKGIVAKPPSLLPSLLRLSVCPLCYGTLSGPSGGGGKESGAERIKEAFLRSTDDDVRCQARGARGGASIMSCGAASACFLALPEEGRDKTFCIFS